jgi:hypothetical protein
VANVEHRFKDRDIRRAVKAARASGIDPVAIEVNPRTGAIKVMGDKAATTEQQSDLDRELEEFDARHGQARG